MPARGGSWRPNCELPDDAEAEGFGASVVDFDVSAVEVEAAGFAAPVVSAPDVDAADAAVGPVDAEAVEAEGTPLVGGTDGPVDPADAVLGVSVASAEAFSASAFTRETSPG